MAAPPEMDYGHGRRRAGRGGSVIGPLILILIGGLLLLQNLGLVSPEVWGNLWRLWPLVLVLIGLEFLVGHRVGALGVLGLMLIVVGGAAVWALTTATASPPSVQTRTLTQPTQGATQANVLVNYGAGQFEIGPLQGGAADQLASMTFQAPAGVEPSVHYQVVDGVGQLQYDVAGRGGWQAAALPWARGGRSQEDVPQMSVALMPSLPLSLTVRVGAADARLDLEQLKVSSLDCSVGASNAWIRMPAAGMTTAHVAGGATALTIEVPTGVAAQIQYRGGLSTAAVDQTRFPQVGDGLFRSPDYETAANRVDLTIDSGLASVTIR
jgi:Domain of unknown function (DUF5668)